jgi:L-amino acid N-acyltransferase YncA
MFITADTWMDASGNDWVLSGVNERLRELYGDGTTMTPEDWSEIRRRRDSELLLVYTYPDADAVLGVAQATYSFRPPYPKVYVNSVVVSQSFRGQSAGSTLMHQLHAECMQRWPRTQIFQLTSSPKRGTKSFYERLGYKARVSSEPGGTVAYERRISAAS